MGVVDTKTYAADTINQAYKGSGVEGLFINKTISIANGDSANSVYRIAQIPSNYVPFLGMVTTAGIAGLTDCDFGLHLPTEQGGAVIDKDAFIDGVNLSSAVTIASPSVMFAAISAANFDKNLNVLESHKSSEYQTYDLTLTLNAAASAAGTINVRALFINGA